MHEASFYNKIMSFLICSEHSFNITVVSNAMPYGITKKIPTI